MSTWTHHRARVAALARDRSPDDPDLRDARRDLRAARLEEHVRKVVEDWPPLTPEQLDRLSGLLHGGGRVA